ncbi:GIY-YIG nuclease family protein [Psychrobacter sp. NPDC064578]|uniref:GIY-YIG nuclease family protein n=1 Tax=Psychrobacter sp. NPDC064578 TaxID=3364493 RepID=UPI003850DF0D
MIKLDEIYKSREYKSLEDIFANDPMGIFDDVKPMSQKTTSNSLLEQQFSEINSFIETHGRPPNAKTGDINEKILSRQLASIKASSSFTKELVTFDKHGLLVDENTNSSVSAESTVLHESVSDRDNTVYQDISSEEEQVELEPPSQPVSFNSLQDIFNSDELGIFDDVQSDILISDSQNSSRANYDQYDDEDVASRFECKDFYKFEATFERIYHAIQSAAFTKTNFASSKSITIGSVFVLNGLLCYVADIYKAEARKNTRSQERLRLIFANGTESNMLTHSLATAQYKYENSYQLLITDSDWIDTELAKNFGDKRQLTGVIYIAKLIDTPDNLAHYKNLHKIGFSTLTGEARTKHSIRDTAFLQQAVDIIAEWEIYDANARSVEGVLHAFFYDQRVKVSLKGSDDKVYKATEWFDSPLTEIEKAINLVISGDIKDYRMDSASGKIVGA